MDIDKAIEEVENKRKDLNLKRVEIEKFLHDATMKLFEISKNPNYKKDQNLINQFKDISKQRDVKADECNKIDDQRMALFERASQLENQLKLEKDKLLKRETRINQLEEKITKVKFL